jgi:hypothetical protein
MPGVTLRRPGIPVGPGAYTKCMSEPVALPKPLSALAAEPVSMATRDLYWLLRSVS